MYVLDTNVVSELRRPDKADPRVRAWAATSSAAEYFLSVITVLEIEHGILLVERRDAKQGKLLRHWLEQELLPRFERRILVIDTAVARASATMHVPDPRPDRDALIAATAQVHAMTVATRNARDFEALGVPVLDPWKHSGSTQR